METYNFREDFGRYKVTYILSILTVFAWLVQIMRFGGESTTPINLINSGAMFVPYVLHNGEFWRLFTPLFVHIGVIHLIMNVFSLFFMGRYVENVFGRWRFLGIYLLSGIFGNALTFYLSFPTNTIGVVSAGASTSIFGIFTAVASIAYFTKHPFLRQIGTTFTTLIIANLVMNLFDLGRIDIWGHVGGAIGGFLLALILPPKPFAHLLKSSYRIFALVAFTLIFIVCLVLPFMTL
ncbi:MAG: rhomboid family intramembrane serine protease [Streptococcaceae bacterium]|nr:rhomboid family intramembrane serine protease [Streptococcaceae bacterium]MCL2681052.1 rhomboid family intramembrane serine protease [Streptococcaceae bacterium]MCL2858272.1 rhomboid family intramembrane serine protease [Streptococcaceae bacterium]